MLIRVRVSNALSGGSENRASSYAASNASPIPNLFFAVIQVPYFFKLIGELSSDSWDIRRCLSQRVSSSINKAVAIRSRYRSV